jgi:hypothetical protein
MSGIPGCTLKSVMQIGDPSGSGAIAQTILRYVGQLVQESEAHEG